MCVFFLYLLLICIDPAPPLPFVWCQGAPSITIYNVCFLPPRLSRGRADGKQMIPLSRAVGSARQKSFEEQWGEIEKGCGFTSPDNESPLPSTWTAHRRLGDGRGDKMTSGQSRSALPLDRSCPVFMMVEMTTDQTGCCDVPDKA